MKEPLSTSAKTCRCGASFPPNRAPQAKFHSDACANRHRQLAYRDRHRIDGPEKWAALSVVDRHSLIERLDVPRDETTLALVVGFLEAA